MKFVKLQWCRCNHIVNNQHLRQMKLEGRDHRYGNTALMQVGKENKIRKFHRLKFLDNTRKECKFPQAIDNFCTFNCKVLFWIQEE